MQQKRLNLEANKSIIKEVLVELSTKTSSNLKETEKILRKYRSVESEVFSKSLLLTTYEDLKRAGEINNAYGNSKWI